MAQAWSARGPWKQRRKKRGSITCPTNWANEANKMFIICLLIIPVLKRWSRARGPYGYLRTWNWPITAREISQPFYKKLLFSKTIIWHYAKLVLHLIYNLFINSAFLYDWMKWESYLPSTIFSQLDAHCIYLKPRLGVYLRGNIFFHFSNWFF